MFISVSVVKICKFQSFKKLSTKLYALDDAQIK